MVLEKGEQSKELKLQEIKQNGLVLAGVLGQDGMILNYEWFPLFSLGIADSRKPTRARVFSSLF